VSEQQLKDAFDAMLAGLERARQALESPDLFAPPPGDERQLAEGYRYLMGFTYAAIERAFFGDPDFPYFRRSIQVTDKSTIDNADAMYLTTPIDGAHAYRISGRMPETPPQYVIWEAHSGYAGDSGGLAELQPGTRANTGKLDTADLVVGPDGRFEILLAPERPEGHEGNFVSTQRTSRKTGTTFTAEHVTMRVLFHDWEHEEALELHICRLDKVGEHPPALTADRAAAALRRVGEIVDNQTRFWNVYYDQVLEAYGDRNGDGISFMPRNDLNAPNAAALATGGGQSTNVYAGGIYELEPDEALVIETWVPVPPAYRGFHLSNLWGESHDYANHLSSLNGHQAEPDSDGAWRYVVAHTDPGVPNWLDTTGLREGYMALRWTYSVKPDDFPTVKVQKVPVAEVRQHLPVDTRTVSADERREAIRVRQEHVQRRYRQY
jgi:hypothetical protein